MSPFAGAGAVVVVGVSGAAAVLGTSTGVVSLSMPGAGAGGVEVTASDIANGCLLICVGELEIGTQGWG